MNVLIIEDEKAAAQRLHNLLKEAIPNLNLLDKIDTVRRAVEWLGINPSPELIFMDIQLADGLSFEIFDHIEVKAPIIFTTAYNEYALKAFKVNSIDYLLKPINPDELKAALQKFEQLTKAPKQSLSVDSQQVQKVLEMLSNPYKSRFLIKIGEKIKSIPVSDILYFLSKEKTTFCYCTDQKRYILDQTLDQLEKMLDPKDFFRLNRQYITRIEPIKDIISYSNSRLKILLNDCDDQDILISREKVNEFKNWLDR